MFFNKMGRLQPQSFAIYSSPSATDLANYSEYRAAVFLLVDLVSYYFCLVFHTTSPDCLVGRASSETAHPL